MPALRALVESAYRGDSARRGWTHEADLLGGDRTSDGELDTVVADPSQRVILAERDGKLLGCVTITDKGNGIAYLGMLAVSPTVQAKGLGRALIEEGETTARREFGTNTMEMTVISRRIELIAWYKRRGYRDTGERRPFPADVPEAPGLEMVVLSRPLNS